MSNFDAWEKVFKLKVKEKVSSIDPAHDILHFQRVVNLAKTIGFKEKACMDIVIPAAWLHDLINVPKNDPLRSQASKMSADQAIEYLKSINYPKGFYDEIHHAIVAHSFSANVPCETLEAKVIQDADRLDGLGAVGIARCFATSGILKRALYSAEDPLCEQRTPNDLDFTLDHFFVKLFKIVDKLHTAEAKKLGQYRLSIMKDFTQSLYREITGQE